MQTMPHQVARMIVLNEWHPLTAWRCYLGISIEKLATMMNCSILEIEKIEQSNLHLKPDVLHRISIALNIAPEALNVKNPNKERFYSAAYSQDLYT